jgi:hypothetical protein
MVTTVSRPGIGSMTQEPGPEGSSVWTLARPGYSALYGELVAVSVVLEDADDLDGVDWDLVAEVRDNPDRYLDAALRFVHGEVLADPAAFGLTVADLDPYRGEFDVERLPLDLPRMTFYADHEWVLHFQSGRLPVCDPYGLIVLFDRRRPARPEGIDGPI